MAQPPRPPPASPPKQALATPEHPPSSRIGWVLGWVVTPTLFFGAIFLGGAYVGANNPEAWVTRSVMWVVNLF